MTRQHITILLLLMVPALSLRAQVMNLNVTINGTTQTTCNATLYDSGGPGGTYQNSENYTVTFCSGTTDCIQIQFVSFNVESNFEYFKVYDGNSVLSPLLGSFTGAAMPPSITSSTSCITISWVSDGSVTYDGFQATITCTGACYVPPPPPTNIGPCTATPITVNPTCIPTQYTNVGATGSGIAMPSCSWSYAGGDVWFSATVPASGLLGTTLSQAGMMTDGGIAVYSGANCNSLTEIACNENTWGMPGTQFVTSTMGLAGQTVWIRIWEPDNDNQGIFNLCAFEPPPFLEVDTTIYSPEELVTEVLVTGCLEAYNVDFTGDGRQIGYFNNGGVVGFNEGVVLCSGYASELFGNGSSTQASQSLTPGLGHPLFANSNDAAVLEFDFVPSSDTLRFNFVFGSEEYPEFVNSSFNDAFAFLITGPNPAGPAYNNTNVALIPGSGIPVTINNLNNGSSSPPTGPCMNCAFYVDNYAGSYNITLDGFTTPMTAEALVIPCQTYHIQMIVTDVFDHILDSFVLLEAGSFSSGGQVAVSHFSSFLGTNEVLEGCLNYFVFDRLDTTDLTDSLQVNVVIGGTAVAGTDYTTMPTSFWIPAGAVSDTVFYNVFLDNMIETNEYIVLSLSNGCPCSMTTVSDTIWITDNFTLNPVISNDTMVCAGQPVDINVSVNPLIDPTIVTYLWSTGDTVTSIHVNPTVTTSYFVTIQDPCAQDTVVGMTVTMVPPISPSFASAKDTICLMESVQISFTGTAGPNAQFTWTFTGGIPATGTGPGPHNVSWSTTGPKDVLLHVNDNGCTGDSTIVIEVLPAPVVTISPVNILCFGTNSGQLTTTTTGLYTPYTYIWSNGSTSQSPTGLPPGNYGVVVTNSYGCTATFSGSITQPSLLTSAAVSTPVSCFGGSNGTTTVTANGGTLPYTYLWNDALQQSTANATGLPAGAYFVTVTDDNGCTSVSTVTVSQPLAPLVSSVTGNNVSCFGAGDGNLDLSVNGGTLPYSFLWSNSSTFEDPQNLGAGSYTVTITDLNGCTLTDGLLITEPTELIYTGFTQPATCFSRSDGSATIQVSGGVPPYQYLWSNGSGASSATGLIAGSYSVTVRDAHSCYFSAHFIVTEPAKVSVSTDLDPTICIGQSITLNSSVTGGTAPYTTTWNTGHTTTAITVNPVVTTVYIVTAEDANGCPSNSDDVTVNVNPPISASASATPNDICLGESVVLTVVPDGGNGNYTYLINNDPAMNPATLFPEENITYEVVVSDNCGTPVVVLQVPVLVRPLPPVSFNSDRVNGCVPLDIQFNEMSPNLGQNFLWDFGDGGNNNTSVEKSPMHTYETSGTFDVNVEVTSVDGCVNHLTIPMFITAYPLPEPQFIAQPDIVSIINPVVHFENMSINNWLSLWSFGDGDSSQTMEPWHHFPAVPGVYNIVLTVLTEYGCKDTVAGTITVKDQYTFFAPNAFSPDADGINEFFLPVGHGIEPDSWLMQIYDRWGNVIFETKNVLEPWGGQQQNGKLVPAGSYTWFVYFKDPTGIGHEHTGSVTVIR